MASKCAALLVGLICVLSCSGQAWASWQQSGGDPNTYLIYPEKMTYVDRSQPLTDVGTGSSVLKVGDEADVVPDGNGEFDYIHACRTYLMFKTTDMQAVISGLTISSAALILQETGREIDNIGPAPASEKINIRLVTGLGAGYSAAGYLNSLSWDGQSDRGITYGGVYGSGTFTANNDGGAKTWTGDVDQLVSGWAEGSLQNFGLVLENDFDGVWSKNNPGDPDSKYKINNPSQMNELEAAFASTTGDYPYIRVTVSPSIVVPEPASGALTLFGIGVMALFRRNKRA